MALRLAGCSVLLRTALNCCEVHKLRLIYRNTRVSVISIILWFICDDFAKITRETYQ